MPEGKRDQGGGFVWRFIDANNYYVDDLFTVFLNDKQLFQVKDKTFKNDRKIDNNLHQFHNRQILFLGQSVEYLHIYLFLSRFP